MVRWGGGGVSKIKDSPPEAVDLFEKWSAEIDNKFIMDFSEGI